MKKRFFLFFFEGLQTENASSFFVACSATSFTGTYSELVAVQASITEFNDVLASGVTNAGVAPAKIESIHQMKKIGHVHVCEARNRTPDENISNPSGLFPFGVTSKHEFGRDLAN